MNLTTFTGIGTIIEHEGNSIIITAGSVAILKSYLGEQHAEEICNVGITVGPRAEIAPAIILDAIEIKSPAQVLAEKLNGREIGKEITREEEAEAKAAGLVVAFGGSDDLAEFRGAIYDEAGIGKIQFTAKGKFFDEDRIEELEGMLHDGEISALPTLNRINATFGMAGHRYTTDIPCWKFAIMEDGEQFSEGLVFSISDLK